MSQPRGRLRMTARCSEASAAPHHDVEPSGAPE
jgi:hypothetical protein